MKAMFVRRPGAVSMVAAGVLALAACGGGGSSEPDVSVPTGTRAATASAGSDLSVQTYPDLSAAMVRGLIGSGSDEFFDLSSAPQRETATAARSSGTRVAAGLDLWRALAVAAMGRVSTRERALATYTEPMPCYSGSGSITWNDADDDRDFSAGDTISMTLSSCVIDPALPAGSGGFSMYVNAVEGSINTALTGLDISISFSNFQLAGLGSMNGGLRLWSKLSGSTSGVGRVSYQAATVAEVVAGVPRTVVYDFDVYSTTTNGVSTSQISGGINIGGQTYVMETMAPLVGQPPVSGALRLRDAAGDFVQLTARTATVFDLDFYLAANPTTAAAMLHDQFWTAYQQP